MDATIAATPIDNSGTLAQVTGLHPTHKTVFTARLVELFHAAGSKYCITMDFMRDGSRETRSFDCGEDRAKAEETYRKQIATLIPVEA